MSNDVRILVLQRGWVLVGYYRREGEYEFLDKAAVIRRWGTTKGLGQIAKEGPTSETILDPCNGEADNHVLTRVLRIKCETEAWRKWLT